MFHADKLNERDIELRRNNKKDAMHRNKGIYK
jgi:hypothetical protein